ncbi:hypothetical protein EKH57_02955 [Halorubrum sp. BOL3-1]|uniref:hypothetical protein n=1 Tax=Halorubrum sp. BOL3-1 TaxID=2497325 RepID=UPI001004DA09|nr:hypothetical protein [Halorubrum sp. BOL3-1]QAU11795.1 hypothetical protein EKH57_02955 [Halorubrum sp. BOL3-1]
MVGSSAREAPRSTADNEAVAGGAAIVVGSAVALSGLLLYQASRLGGSHVAAVGLALAVAGVFATERVSGRLGVSTETRRRLALGFGALAAALTLAFFVVDYPGFSGAVAESGGESTTAALRFRATATRLAA